MWGDLHGRPTYVLTGDQDWCPEWALADTIALAADLEVPFHVFATSPSPLLEHPPDGVTVGAHPNFLPGSSHGATPEEVVATCRAMYPAATTFRTHCFAEATPWLRMLVGAGFPVDSNLCCHLQPDLMPLLHASGTTRLPVFLEDDVLLSVAGETPPASAVRELLSPGLKVLNFHPALVASNVPDLEEYDRIRPVLYGSEERVGWAGRGVRDLLVDLVRIVTAEGLRFEAFPDVADRAVLARAPAAD